MGQFKALMYKNFKLQSKNACSSIFQLVVPIICVLIVLSLQQLAISLSENNEKQFPVDMPFNVATMLNLPLTGEWANKYAGIKSCLKVNKYGFSNQGDMETQKFVDEQLYFNNDKHLRNFICRKKDKPEMISPFFNKTIVNTIDELNWDIKEEMNIVYDSELAYREDHTTPSDGYYLFHEANLDKINVTIMSNNMNNQMYHRPNGQTQISFGTVPVK